MPIKRFIALITVVAVVLITNLASAQGNTPPDPSKFELVKVVGDLENPIYLTNAGDGSGRLFVLEQSGNIFIIKDGALDQEPFLDLTGVVNDEVLRGGYTERGLLGLVFHPQYKDNGLFFVYYVDRQNQSILARYHVNKNTPDQADPSSAVTLLSVKHPFENHKGGQLAFGPDGYLYLGIGDGGSLTDPQGNGQRLDTLLGKILRIDVSDVNTDKYKVPGDNPFVNNKAAAPEIWAYGLRNPWRFSFDPLTGDLYIGDVGEATWEEVDVQAKSSHGGENYGWSLFEGYSRFKEGTPATTPVLPVAVYSHADGCAIVGGHVYRGKALPALLGIYLFADYCSGRTWMLYRDGSEWKTLPFIETGRVISSFGLDEQGELYMVDYKGTVLRLQSK